MPEVRLMLGDCLERMAEIADGSVDLILTDLPYGSTQCAWDSIIPLEPLWAHYERVLKSTGAVVLTACQPFMSKLVMSRPKWFRHEWAWDKVNVTGHLEAKYRPLRRHEGILVFSPYPRPTYNPQRESGESYSKAGGREMSAVYGKHPRLASASDGKRYPTTIIRIPNSNRAMPSKVHPTQKPVALMEYLIFTYSNESETILDSCMGSGTTGVACLNTGRDFIGIEKDSAYFATASARIEAAQRQQSEMLALG